MGIFTDGGGRRHLAYGYFTPNQTPAFIGGIGMTPPQIGPVCTEWKMLDANSGEHIESSWLCPRRS